MRNDQDKWNLARLRMERHGPDPRARAQTAEEPLSCLAGAKERAPVVDVIRATQVLLVVENPTIH